MNWQQAISHCHHIAQPFAVVTVMSTSGSTPRAGSAKMVVTELVTHDTIGGGQLEYLVIESARKMLQSRVPSQSLDHYPLASKAGQCCGGSVTVLIESFPVSALRLAVFGAGHVASALVQVMAQCDARISWIDSRQEQFPQEVSSNVRLMVTDDPVLAVNELTDQDRVVIVTHDHALDYRILVAVLGQTEATYIGLIGSQTKANRFMDRLNKDGFTEADQSRCYCPIGLSSVPGKLPMEIAVSIAAQILSLNAQAASEIKPDLSWKEIRQSLAKPS